MATGGIRAPYVGRKPKPVKQPKPSLIVGQPREEGALPPVKPPKTSSAGHVTGGTLAPGSPGYVAPAASAQNPNPTATAAQPTTRGPAPELPESVIANKAADTEFGVSSADLQHQAYLAALKYGDPATIQSVVSRYGLSNPVVDNPNSDLALAARNQADQYKGNDANHLGNWTFRSGSHLVDREKIGDIGARARLQAYQDYDKAMSDIALGLSRATNTQGTAHAQTGLADIRAQEALPTIPQGAPVKKPTAAPPSKAQKAAAKTKQNAVDQRGAESIIGGLMQPINADIAKHGNNPALQGVTGLRPGATPLQIKTAAALYKKNHRK